jgi:hypothetical protein
MRKDVISLAKQGTDAISVSVTRESAKLTSNGSGFAAIRVGVLNAEHPFIGNEPSGRDLRTGGT